jgi:hypothetical protein
VLEGSALTVALVSEVPLRHGSTLASRQGHPLGLEDVDSIFQLNAVMTAMMHTCDMYRGLLLQANADDRFLIDVIGSSQPWINHLGAAAASLLYLIAVQKARVQGKFPIAQQTAHKARDQTQAAKLHEMQCYQLSALQGLDLLLHWPYLVRPTRCCASGL